MYGLHLGQWHQQHSQQVEILVIQITCSNGYAREHSLAPAAFYQVMYNAHSQRDRDVCDYQQHSSRLRRPMSMSELNWYDFTLLTLLLLTTIGQCYVIWIVVEKSPKSMSEYRYFLCLCTVGFQKKGPRNSFSNLQIWDMVFTIVVGGLVHPDPIFPARAVNVAGLGALFGGEVGAKISVRLQVVPFIA